jgi:hypothetical protein
MATDYRINEDFFNFVDTPLKAYIIGLVAFNSNNAIAADTLNVLIKLNNVKEHDNNNKSISYGYYKDLKSEDQKNYPYFNNIDVLIEHLKELGNVKYSENGCINGIIDLTINSQKIKNDVSEAREFFERMSEDIKFPQYERPTEEDDNQLDIEAQEERQKFLESLNGVENRLGALQFNWKDDKASLSINGKFEIPAQEASTYRDAAESLQDYYAERYYQDGKYQSDKLIKDLYIADNFDKIIQSVISQTANQTRLEMLKQRKNITTDVEQGGTYRPSAADEERNLFDQLFMGHKQRQL